MLGEETRERRQVLEGLLLGTYIWLIALVAYVKGLDGNIEIFLHVLWILYIGVELYGLSMRQIYKKKKKAQEELQ